MRVPGRWREGYVLDYHTVSSEHVGDDEFGHPEFKTVRSEIGEQLYRLKYRSDQAAVAPLMEVIAAFVVAWNPGIDVIVPAPASKTRAVQPVTVLAEGLSQRIGVPCFADAIRRTRETPELKNVFEYGERVQHLVGAHEVDPSRVRGRRVLLFDDLYRSGATLDALAAALFDRGTAIDVVALAVTRTRSHR